MMKFKTITLEAAAKRFEIGAFSLFENIQNYNKEDTVKVIEEDTVLDELYLDCLNEEKTIAYVFMKSLTVLGNIWNEEVDFGGISLVVLQDLKAKNMAVGGQEIYIQGNVVIDGLLCGSYNHGAMKVIGDVKAKYILNDDYTFYFGGKVDAPILSVYNEGYYAIKDWTTLYQNYECIEPSNIDFWNVLNPKVYDIYHDSFEFPKLLEILNTNETLFVSREEKKQGFTFDTNANQILEILNNLRLFEDTIEFGFVCKSDKPTYQIIKKASKIALWISLDDKTFKYEIQGDYFDVYLLEENDSPKLINMNSNFRSFYQAKFLLEQAKIHFQEYIVKREHLLKMTQNLLKSIDSTEYLKVYSSLEELNFKPNEYYLNNKPFFDSLNINYLNKYFQRFALVNILLKSSLGIAINEKENIGKALDAIMMWLNSHEIYIEVDWQKMGLKLGRRIEHFANDVLKLNDVLKENNIPLSILLYKTLSGHKNYAVFIPVKNQNKDLFTKWLNEFN